MLCISDKCERNPLDGSGVLQKCSKKAGNAALNLTTLKK